MLAQFLEKLLDTDAYSPKIRAVGYMVYIAAAVVLFSKFGKNPTHAEDTAAAKSTSYQGLIERKEPNVRGRIQVWISTSVGGLVEADDLEDLYQETAYARLVMEMPDNKFPFNAAHAFILPLKANVGDSVVKKAGELTAKVIHGDSVCSFRYKCGWHPDSL